MFTVDPLQPTSAPSVSGLVNIILSVIKKSVAGPKLNFLVFQGPYD